MHMKNRNYFWGIVFILAAVFVLLSNFGLFHNINMTKILFTILLLCIMVKNVPCRNFYGILIPAAIIVIMYDDFLPVRMFTPFPVLAAAIFGSIGLSFLFPNQPPFKPDIDFDPGSASGKHSGESDVHCSTSFAGTTKYFETENFRRAYLKCSFGALKAYFDHARIQGASAEIYVENSFGETTLFLPKEWNVTVTATTSFGDITEVHKPPVPMADAPVVSVRGNISFGDCKIFYI